MMMMMVMVMCGRAVCEQGNLQVFFQDLPLSIQDGYERFLSSSSVGLLQYQVQASHGDGGTRCQKKNN